jgi:hypothetical protein
MIDQLRFLLDRHLDPLAARAVVVFATTILLGFAALFVLGLSESDRATAPREQVVSTRPQPRPSLDPVPHRRRQDPQDQKDSPAARRAARTLRSHRAFQHVPYQSGELIVVLVGTRGNRAELRVSASTAQAARQGWRQFLQRYRDSGRAYIPLFKSTSGGPNG